MGSHDEMTSAPHTIVIVGGGFSGTTLATNLLRRARGVPLRIVLLDRGQLTRGAAYARRDYPYLLNVPAGRMSANSADPGEFLAFARRFHADASADDFLPRELYGDYLEASLRNAESAAPAEVGLRRVYGEAVEIERFHRSSAVQVHLADGRKLAADTVVLALGNPPPAQLQGTETEPDPRRCIEDPWRAPTVVRAGETILLVGTGLTAADAIVAGNHAAGGKASFHALSRHGLLPPHQSHFERAQLAQFDASSLTRAAAISLRTLVHAARALAEDLELRGGDWRQAIGLVRDLAPTLWQRLSTTERRRFLRHVRAYWDIHRHRLADATWATLNELRGSGRLCVHAGRLVRLQRSGRRVRVTWRPRGGNGTRVLLVDRVINCTGPDYNVRRTRERLLRALVAQGVAIPDPLGVGLSTDESGALVDVAGRAVRDIYYLGPMLRATYWETTAVAELREYAARLADHLTWVLDERRTPEHRSGGLVALRDRPRRGAERLGLLQD